MVIIRVYYRSSHLFENFHNKKFLKFFSRRGKYFVDLVAERLIRIGIVESFPLIIRTKSLSRGATTE